MLNKTGVEVTYSLEEIITIAFRHLATRNLVPHINKSYAKTLHPVYKVKNGEGKITDSRELTVSFSVEPLPTKESKDA